MITHRQTRDLQNVLKRISWRTISWGSESSTPKQTCSSVTDLSMTGKKISPTGDSREMWLEKLVERGFACLLELGRQQDRELVLVLEEIHYNEIEQSLVSYVWRLQFMKRRSARLAKLPKIFFRLWSKDNNWSATEFAFQSSPWSISWFSSLSATLLHSRHKRPQFFYLNKSAQRNVETESSHKVSRERAKPKRLTLPLPLRRGKFDADPDQQASVYM